MFNLVSRSCVPLWLPCQFLCCRVSHFLLFVCAGGCQARWNAAEVILGRRGSAPVLGSTWPASPCSGLASLHMERAWERQQGIEVPTWLLQVDGQGWHVQCYVGCGGWWRSGRRDLRKILTSAAVLPWQGGAETRAAFGRGGGPGMSQLLPNLSWPQCSAPSADHCCHCIGLKVWPLAACWDLLPGTIWAALRSRGRELESYSCSGATNVAPELDMALRICIGVNVCPRLSLCSCCLLFLQHQGTTVEDPSLKEPVEVMF